MADSRCGILCSEYKRKMKCGDCQGCNVTENPFWGVCDVKNCCESKKLEHCGLCADFPCEDLKMMSYDDSGQGDNGKRIEQCKKWACNKKRKNQP